MSLVGPQPTVISHKIIQTFKTTRVYPILGTCESANNAVICASSQRNWRSDGMNLGPGRCQAKSRILTGEYLKAKTIGKSRLAIKRGSKKLEV
ncbi:hypothetical protein Ancab_007724 [Ancistrocladus abbreviatus]